MADPGDSRSAFPQYIRQVQFNRHYLVNKIELYKGLEHKSGGVRYGKSNKTNSSPPPIKRPVGLPDDGPALGCRA